MLASVACVFAATMIEIASFDASSGQRADAAIVLGAASWGLTPSPVFRERIRQAVSLYRSGQVRKIIFTGGRRLDTDSYEAEVGRSTAISLGAAPSDILVETCSRSTEENLERAFAVGKDNGLTSYLIVSDPLHLRRAQAIADALGMTAAPSATTTSRIQSVPVKLRFVLREAYFLVRRRLHFDPSPAKRLVDRDRCGA